MTDRSRRLYENIATLLIIAIGIAVIVLAKYDVAPTLQGALVWIGFLITVPTTVIWLRREWRRFFGEDQDP